MTAERCNIKKLYSRFLAMKKNQVYSQKLLRGVFEPPSGGLNNNNNNNQICKAPECQKTSVALADRNSGVT